AERINFSVFDIPNQNRVAELAEVCRSLGDGPWVRERSSGGKIRPGMILGLQNSSGGEEVYYAPQRRRETTARLEKFSVLVFHLERRVAGVLRRNVRISKGTDITKVPIKHIEPVLHCVVANATASLCAGTQRFK